MNCTVLQDLDNAVSLNEIATCVFATWSPRIGDPTIIGWLTVAAYSLTAVLTALVFVRQSGRQRIFWLGLFVLLVALAINKQLDLQSALTAAGRCLALAQGWYESRQSVQITFIIAVGVTCIVIGVVLAWALRRDFGQVWLALVGVALLLAFVVMRAAGFHNFDRFIGFEIANIRMNWVMELGGIMMIAANALRRLVRARGSFG